MFDVGFWELTVIGVTALIVVGPERLPGLARSAGRYVGEAQRVIQRLRQEFERELHAEEYRQHHAALERRLRELQGPIDSEDPAPAASTEPTPGSSAGQREDESHARGPAH